MLLLIEDLVRRGVECTAFVLEGDGPLRPRLDATGARVKSMGHAPRRPRLRTMAMLVRAMAALWWTAVRWRPDVVHAYLPLTNFMGALAGRLAFVPLVVTSRRSLGTHQERRRLWFLFDRLANRLSHFVTCNSRAVGDDTIARDGIDPKKLVLVRNALDPLRFGGIAEVDRTAQRSKLRIANGTVAIVTVANMIPYKGHADLIEAIAILPAEVGCHFFLVGGDEGLRPGLEQQARRLGVLGRVTFLGSREDVFEILSAMDIFVLPSHEEGFSNALIEALSLGLQIVATAVGGNPEALEDGRLGILVPPRDPPAMAAAIRKAAADLGQTSARRLAVGKATREKYAVAAMTDAHLAIYGGDCRRFQVFAAQDRHA